MLDTMQHKASGAAILEAFIKASPSLAALTLEQMPLNEAVFWFSSLNMDSITLCFEHMNPQKAAHILRRLPVKQSAYVAARLPASAAALIVQNLPVHYKAKLTASMDAATVKMFESVLAYGEGSAAFVMRANFLAFKTDAKIKDILLRLKSLPKPKIPFCVYITDKSGRGAGFIKTAELPFFADTALAGSVMAPVFDKVNARDNKEQVISAFKSSGAPCVAVVDGDGFIIGIINAVELLFADDKRQAQSANAGLLGRLFKK